MFSMKIIKLAVGLALISLFVTGCATATTAPPETQVLALEIKTTVLNDGQMGIGYYKKLEVTGGSGHYTWSLTEGSLPDGLGINSDTGIISGNPKVPGVKDFTVQVNEGKTSASQKLSLTIKPATQTIVISNPKIVDGEVGASYSQKLAASGGNGSFTWSVSGGTLPEGLALDTTTGVISGMPKIVGGTSFSVQVTDGSNTTTQGFSLVIQNSIIISTASFPNGKVDSVYDELVEAIGGSGTNTWSISRGVLPDGLTFESTNAEIYGTPTKAGVFTFTLKLIDSLGGTATKDFSITVDQSTPTPTPTPT
jgi:large repetitive protein